MTSNVVNVDFSQIRGIKPKGEPPIITEQHKREACQMFDMTEHTIMRIVSVLDEPNFLNRFITSKVERIFGAEQEVQISEEKSTFLIALCSILVARLGFEEHMFRDETIKKQLMLALGDVFQIITTAFAMGENWEAK